MVVALVMLMGSCTTPKLGYFQNLNAGESIQLQTAELMKVEPGDKLSIVVSSKNPELAYLFNIPMMSNYNSNGTTRTTHSTTRTADYTVDSQGNIDFPVLGQLHIAGMSREEVVKYVKQRILATGMLKDAMVTVELLNLHYAVIGEVRSPGRFAVDRDVVTLLDALSRAGDLTIYGRRDNVLVTRSEGGREISYRIDLSDARSLYNSPAFYLKQNDIVYVEPNTKRARESTLLGNSLTSPSFWMSVASFTMTLILFLRKF